MSSKRATYYYRRFNWEEINNMFCYDVKFPERLTKRQQILRLYKNSLRRVWDLEITGFRQRDIESYANGCREIRADFEKLKTAKSTEEIEDMQEKYENYIESTYQVTPYFRDNVAYEWRHGKGLLSYPSAHIETDYYGYYSQDLDLFPKPREFDFRHDFDENEGSTVTDHNLNGWENVSLTQSEIKSREIKSPEELKNYIEELRQKVKH